MADKAALRLDIQEAGGNQVLFEDREHERFYYEKLSQMRQQNCYHKALVYLLGISVDTRRHFQQIYDIKTGCIKTECLHQKWQTSGTLKIVRLAFNLYTDRIPSIEDGLSEEEKLDEYRQYSVSDIFCCGYARWFWQAIRLRYSGHMEK